VIVEMVRIAVAAVLMVAALGKLADREASRASVVAFGVPAVAAGAVGWVLTGAELGTATALLFAPWPEWASAGALALLAIVSGAVAANLIRGRAPECHCFGRLSRGPIGWSTLARNGVLAAIAGYVAANGRQPLMFLALASVFGAAWLALTTTRRGVRGGAVAPAFSLAEAAGPGWTLARLLGRERAVLLVFSQPGCGACQALLGDLRDWHVRLGDRLTIAVVSPVSAAGAGYGSPEQIGYLGLVDPGSATASAYGVTATPSAVLIEPNGRLAAPIAQGAEEIGGLVTARFGEADSEGLARRAVILRALGGATTLGAFPLLAAACGSSQSSSTAGSQTQAKGVGRPKSLRAGGAYICRQRYALCTNAACRPSPHDPNTVICDCVVKDGYSVGLTPCSHRAPHGATLYSTFSTALVTTGVRAMTCAADVPWANCVDFPCRLDPSDASKATCQCGLVKSGPSFTFGGDCHTDTCGKTVWSGAHTTLGGPAVTAAMKRVGQPLVTPTACPKS
jgi:peroxiredoxin